jgi:hypothetical protein
VIGGRCVFYSNRLYPRDGLRATSRFLINRRLASVPREPPNEEDGGRGNNEKKQEDPPMPGRMARRAFVCHI